MAQGLMDWREIGDLHLWLDRKGLAPEAEAHLKMMSWWQNMNALDQEDFQRAQNVLGEGSFRWVASIPMSVWCLLLDLHPTILQDKAELHRWLRSNPQYLVPNGR